jgi:small subunit ribosomal protein S8e
MVYLFFYKLGNFSWGSEAVARKTRITRVVYNASNNELVRTNTLVKGCIVEIDAAPFRQWYEGHYAIPIGRKKGTATEEVPETKKSNHLQRKFDARRADHSVESPLVDQFLSGKVLACLSSRPGQSGRADGYILEGKELEFYQRKLKSKKA